MTPTAFMADSSFFTKLATSIPNPAKSAVPKTTNSKLTTLIWGCISNANDAKNRATASDKITNTVKVIILDAIHSLLDKGVVESFLNTPMLRYLVIVPTDIFAAEDMMVMASIPGSRKSK